MGTLSVDRLGPVSCGVFPPYISLGLAHLTCSMIGLESGNLDIPRQGQNPELFVVFLEPFQRSLCKSTSASGSVLGLQQCLDAVKVISTWMPAPTALQQEDLRYLPHLSVLLMLQMISLYYNCQKSFTNWNLNIWSWWSKKKKKHLVQICRNMIFCTVI